MMFIRWRRTGKGLPKRRKEEHELAKIGSMKINYISGEPGVKP